MVEMKTIFEISKQGRKTGYLPKSDVSVNSSLIPKEMLRDDNGMPEVSEVEVVRHYTALSKRNFGVDHGFYPLGSCTMKYNPKANEDIAVLSGFAETHPYSDFTSVQGNLEVIYDLENQLSEITGMDAVTLQPAAGAHGELTGLMLIKAYFKDKGEDRKIILTTDSSHGTNPASASMCGFTTVTLKSNSAGKLDIQLLRDALNKDVAAIMLTIPNTLGIFEEGILEITDLVHKNGSLVYMDGANMNALLGMVRPKEMGVDVMHLNLHKSFSTPHGCGGPGSGPVAVARILEPFLPVPRVMKKDGKFMFEYKREKSIGRVKAFYGNYGVMLKAYSYILALGGEGLRNVAINAVLNANYMKEKLKRHYNLAYDVVCKHEFVLDDSKMPNGITTSDIAKRLIDYGFHPPTIYFPLIVHGAIMIEPTETENKETLDSFADAMIKIVEEATTNPEIIKSAPHSTPVNRLDDVQAARKPVLKFAD